MGRLELDLKSQQCLAARLKLRQGPSFQIPTFAESLGVSHAAHRETRDTVDWPIGPAGPVILPKAKKARMAKDRLKTMVCQRKSQSVMGRATSGIK